MASGLNKSIHEREKRAFAVVMGGVQDLLKRGYSASFFDNVPGCNFQIVFWKDINGKIDSQRMVIPWNVMMVTLSGEVAKKKFNRIMQRLNLAAQEMRRFMTVMIQTSNKKNDELIAADESENVKGGEDVNSGRQREEVK